MDGGKNGFTEYQINFMKVALAMVIIRQKPASQNIRQFTEKLQLEFSQKQTHWKLQAELLSQELKELKQVKYLQSIENLTGIDQSSIPTSTSTNSLLSTTGSRLLTSNNDPTPAAVPVSSYQYDEEQQVSSVIPQDLMLHITFIQNASNILRQSSYLNEDQLRHNTISLSTIKESIIRAIHMLSDSLATTSSLSHLLANEDIVRKLIQCLLNILKMNSITAAEVRFNQERSDIIRAITALLHTFMDRLTCYDNCSGVVPDDVSLFLQSCIYQLSSSEELFACAIVTLAKRIEEFVEKLRNFKENPFILEPKHINVLGSVIRVLENIVTKYNHLIPNEAMNHLEKAVQVAMVLHLPLVGFAVWKLHVQILESKKENSLNNKTINI